MLRRITLLAALLAFVPLSRAADNGFYLGAGYAQSDYGLDNPLDVDDFDDEDGGFKLIAGFRPIDSFGVEANYIDHGDATIGPVRFSAETLSAFAVGYLDFPLVDLFAKAGVASWQFDGRAAGDPDFSFDEDDLDFAWGAGVQVRFLSLAARLEYEQFKVIEDEDIGTISLSLTYTFL